MTSQESESPEQNGPRASRPRRVRLPGFVREDEIGLGDLIKRVTYALYVNPCGGCEKRAAVLNRWIAFTR